PEHLRALIDNWAILAAIVAWLVCHATPLVLVCAAIDVVILGLWGCAAYSEAKAWVAGLAEIVERVKLAETCCDIEEAAEIMADLLCHLPLDALLMGSGPSVIRRGRAGAGTLRRRIRPKIRL
ncbi:hypothetical protein C4L39_26410, partial [Clostridium diolis]|uniref:hypothetical protein n=1 Tax=Clostridium diolis TaxID=223919 RepID=UPI000D2E4D2E